MRSIKIHIKYKDSIRGKTCIIIIILMSLYYRGKMKNDYFRISARVDNCTYMLELNGFNRIQIIEVNVLNLIYAGCFAVSPRTVTIEEFQLQS